MTRFSSAVVIATTAVAMTACSQPEPDVSPTPIGGVEADVVDTEPSPLRLVEPAPDPSQPSTAPAAPEDEGPDDPPTASEEPDPLDEDPSDEPAPAPAEGGEGDGGASRTVVLLALADAVGDHGTQGPRYADLTAFELVSRGNDLEVTLRFAQELPVPPADGEVILTGVDIGDGDDAYQLFVTGNADGWTAYLYTPSGFTAYPGTFTIAGATVRLGVPWNAVGSPMRAPVKVFVEWSKDSGLIGALNPASTDRLDGEPHSFDRNP